MGYAATYAARALGAGAEIRFRDSIALRESYESFYAHLDRERYDYLFIESATPSWEHDKAVLLEIHRRLPRTRFAVAGPIASTNAEKLS